jgi:hypothetical protein
LATLGYFEERRRKSCKSLSPLFTSLLKAKKEGKQANMSKRGGPASSADGGGPGKSIEEKENNTVSIFLMLFNVVFLCAFFFQHNRNLKNFHSKSSKARL